ncbi:non-specific lipid transfer protein GPI-anchored 25 isoform X2 [Primulina tabacum]|uniref:non-specific lipid transfer protein GPI-anchored 25 isoform X2 n=1 Tax=Primulina tabacum TaxID=48773 RepID=UPI003F5A35B0
MSRPLLLHAALILLLQFAAAATPHPSACSDELVTFTTCLPYVSDSPNNLTESPPPQCCDDISTAFSTGSAVCLCYFLLRPGMLGFPLNSSKLMSLTSVCPAKHHDSEASFSLGTLCSESAALPPLQAITGANVSPPSPPLMGSPQQSPGGSSLPPEADDAELPTQPPPSTTAFLSIATEGFRNFDRVKTLPMKLIFLIYILKLM